MWQMNNDGTIQLVNTSLCLDLSGKTSVGGSNVVIEKCQSGEYIDWLAHVPAWMWYMCH